MNKEDIAKCNFVPMCTLKKVMEYIETPIVRDTRCKRNLLYVQSQKLMNKSDMRRTTWFYSYPIALRHAIYSHDWNSLAFILKKSPIWEHRPTDDNLPVYLRALTILLMYHPSSKAQMLLNDYLHMVLACRSDEDKKALYKALLSLLDKLYERKRRFC